MRQASFLRECATRYEVKAARHPSLIILLGDAMQPAFSKLAPCHPCLALALQHVKLHTDSAG